jgi:hypothetical protein
MTREERIMGKRKKRPAKVVKLDKDKFLADYKKARANRSAEAKAEELFEMRAAFGEGQEVVNIITGEITKT